MKTIQLQVEDSFYQDIMKSGIDIQGELKKLIKKAVYQKEHKMASEIVKTVDDVKQGKTKPIEELFSEV